MERTSGLLWATGCWGSVAAHAYGVHLLVAKSLPTPESPSPLANFAEMQGFFGDHHLADIKRAAKDGGQIDGSAFVEFF